MMHLENNIYIYALNFEYMTKKKSNDKVLKRIESDVFINPKTDFGFKKIFGNKTLLIAFLRTVLSEEITEIEYLHAEQLGYIEENRKAVYDVYCMTSAGKRFIVEMQASPQPHLAERLLFYVAYPIISQAPKGKVMKINKAGEQVESAWDYSIEGIYMIVISENDMFTEAVARNIPVETVKLVRQTVNIVYTDKLKFVTIELSKFKKTETELDTLLDKWLFSMKNMEKLPNRPQELNDEIFEKLYENAKIFNLTEKEMKAYNKSIMKYDDVILAVDYAEERGRKEVMSNLVQNCYKNGMSIEQIVKYTGLAKEQVSDILSKS
jgi:predicted transposase/invertase (TIGR01784 family)